MPRGSNPFAELYVSETIPPQDFVQLFSPFLVPQAIELFQPGNVVLLGVQGSGKSMLLSLFRPAIRVAYAKAFAESRQTRFPVPEEQEAFLSAGVNLRRTGASSFGQRRIEESETADLEQMPLYFGDFLNYQVVFELCSTLDTFMEHGKGIPERLGLTPTTRRLNTFAVTLARDECWFGALDHVRTYAELRLALRKRIQDYFRFLNFNSRTLPDEVRSTKTHAGIPISRTAWGLRAAQILPSSTPIFVVIDEYDELGRIAAQKGAPAHHFTRIVNSAISTRDPNFSYRIGSRPYGWKRDLKTFSTGSEIENQRDYSTVNIDRLLRRPENIASYIFPAFVDDVLRRRLTYAHYRVPDVKKAPKNPTSRVAQMMFGRSMQAADVARLYAGASGATAMRRGLARGNWTDEWIEFLAASAHEDPLSAKLAEAWGRQGGGKRMQRRVPPPDSKNGLYPWESTYWRKERVQQALLQIATTNAQSLVWGGVEQVIALSGGNIFVFLSLSRRIWETFLRSRDEESDLRADEIGDDLHKIPKIPIALQTIGLEIASAEWFNKIIELPGGNQRQRFIEVLGRFFRKQLQDLRMSYPGHNGFSTRNDEVDAAADVRALLEDAVDYGDLFSTTHTTKSKAREQRTKWYLKPVLSPHLKLPVTHVKEPYYASVDEVRDWMRVAEASPMSDALPRAVTIKKARLSRRQ